MGIIESLFTKPKDWISTFIAESSRTEFALAALTVLIIFTALGLIAFFWWIIFKGLNHGGTH